MAAPLDAPLAPFLTLTDGMSIRLTALDAATGATVAGVTISGRSISVDPGGDTSNEPAPSPVSGAYTSGGSAA